MLIMHKWQGGSLSVLVCWFVADVFMSLSFIFFNSDAGHKSQSVGLQNHSTSDSRAIKCTYSFKILCMLRTCSGNETKLTAKEGVGRIFINCTLTNSSTPTYLKPGLLAFLRSFHHLGNSSTPPTQGSKSF